MSNSPIDQVRAVLVEVCALLDEERFADWLAKCPSTFSYQITAFSPEINKAMTWLSLDLPGLRKLVAQLEDHERYPGRFHRSLGYVYIESALHDSFYLVKSALTVHHTDEDGETKLFAVGRYVDRFRRNGQQLLIESRDVQLSTRRLAFGSHAPI